MLKRTLIWCIVLIISIMIMGTSYSEDQSVENINKVGEISVGANMQLNITTPEITYSWDMDATLLFEPAEPFLIGVKADYQFNFQRVAIISGFRLLTGDIPLKIDFLVGGGLASINDSPWKYIYFTGGVVPKLMFYEGAYLYVGAFYSDITTESNAYSFMNASTGVGLSF